MNLKSFEKRSQILPTHQKTCQSVYQIKKINKKMKPSNSSLPAGQTGKRP